MKFSTFTKANCRGCVQTFKLVVDSPYDSESNKGAFRIATPAIFEDDTILEGIIYGLEIAVQRYIEGESREVEVFGDEA